MMRIYTSASHFASPPTFSKTFETPTAPRIALDIRCWSKHTMRSSLSSLFADSFSNAVDQTRVKGSTGTGGAGEARARGRVEPRDTSNTIWSVAHLRAFLAQSEVVLSSLCSLVLTLTRGTPKRGTGQVCHMSFPLRSAIFSS